jgi:hypothetical protein
MSYEDSFKVGKTYRTASEAFKDATYATAIWRCETKWGWLERIVGNILMAILIISPVFSFIYGLIIWAKI